MFSGVQGKAVNVHPRPAFLDEKGKLFIDDSFAMNKIIFFIWIHILYW